jgi:hypothetical protein
LNAYLLKAGEGQHDRSKGRQGTPFQRDFQTFDFVVKEDCLYFDQAWSSFSQALFCVRLF